jgi:uncharacterized protein YqfB (UPF0267 family)
MKEIEIPFLPRFREDIGNAQKIMTTRTKKYGEPGDYFWVNDGKFRNKIVLLAVFRMRLWHVAGQLYEAEGLSSPEEFKKVWNQIHPKRSYEESAQENFWVHIFSPTSEWAGYEPDFESVVPSIEMKRKE